MRESMLRGDSQTGLATMRAWLKRIKRQLLRPVCITVGAGIVLVSLPPLARLSFDLAHLGPFRPDSALTNVVIVLANENTVSRLGDGRGRIDWTHHVRLLDRLARDGARLVFYDFIFSETNPAPELNQMLARAVQRHGSVVLVEQAYERHQEGNYIAGVTPLPEPLGEAARAAGHGQLFGNVVRTVPRDFAGENCAVWKAAMQLAPDRFRGEDPNLERWLNYYGQPPDGGFPTLLFDDVVSESASNFFAQKIVFVGQTSPPDRARSYKDTFATPYTLFGQKPLPGVTVHATALINLIRDEWLQMAPLPWQWLAAGIWGIVVAILLFSLSRKPRVILILAALAGAGTLWALSLFAQSQTYWWWAWIGPTVGQTSVALIWVVWNPKPDPYIAFISYRTEDDGAGALLIATRLKEKGHNTFIDVKSLTAGRFDEQLLREIEDATFFVLILSPRSLARCVKKDDWVLRELTHALSKEKKIIPVFRSGFTFEPKTDVPELKIPDLPEIAAMKNHQGVTYHHDDFEGFMARLIDLMKLKP